jgi:hypothetical protein
MLLALPALIAALIAGASDQEGARKKLSALGLGDDGQERMPFGREFADLFVPVWAWDDGASIWKMVLPAGFNMIEAVGLDPKKLESEDVEEGSNQLELNPRSYVEGGPNQYVSSADIDVYVWLHGEKIVAAFLVGKNEFDVTGRKALEEKDKLRIEQFIRELYGNDLEDEVREVLRLDTLIVDDEVETARVELDRIWGENGADAAKAFIHKNGKDWWFRHWIEEYLDLKDVMSEMEHLSSNYRSMIDEGSEAWFDQGVADGVHEEESREHAESMFQDALNWEAEELRGLASKVVSYFKSEAYAVETGKIIGGIDVQWQDDHDGWGGRLELRLDHMARYDDPIETVVLSFDEDYLSPGIDTEGHWFREDLQKPGLYTTLRKTGVLLTRSEIAQKAGQPSWKFPGDLQGQWEALDLVGVYRPTGVERVPLFCIIAAEHGLLSPAAQQAWQPVIDRLPEVMELLQDQHLIEN